MVAYVLSCVTDDHVGFALNSGCPEHFGGVNSEHPPMGGADTSLVAANKSRPYSSLS